MRPRVIDLFSGVGGLSLGFEIAGFDVILANEYDTSIANSYSKNHPGTGMIIGDITKLDLKEIFYPYKNKIDVIIGGPPCQGFSQKGKRKTIYDERNYLFQYFVKTVFMVKPRYFLMENVPNLLTAENGFFIQEIEELFLDLGYKIKYKVLNASDYGVPQNRRRAIIIGKLGSIPPRFPDIIEERVNVWDAISDLNYLNSGEGEEVSEYLLEPRSNYQRMLRDGSGKLYNHKSTKHSEVVLQRLSLIPSNGNRDALPKQHLTKSTYSGTWSRMKVNEPSVTITTRFDTPSSGQFTHPYLNRAVTVREAARIQSFPDKFIFYGNKSSQMKQVGNAVPPLMAEKIAKAILEDIKEAKND